MNEEQRIRQIFKAYLKQAKGHKLTEKEQADIADWEGYSRFRRAESKYPSSYDTDG